MSEAGINVPIRDIIRISCLSRCISGNVSVGASCSSNTLLVSLELCSIDVVLSVVGESESEVLFISLALFSSF